MGALTSRQHAGVEEVDIPSNSVYRYPPKSGGREAGAGGDPWVLGDPVAAASPKRSSSAGGLREGRAQEASCVAWRGSPRALSPSTGGRERPPLDCGSWGAGLRRRRRAGSAHSPAAERRPRHP
ncbi:hypothetical protein P7K49_011849 [Saguinus oedipus]|uniref:Uncharacterized protein n=1 Tax=Saguinus oedipus TaxID=9490 RepID=A0ABQ9VVD3_SAGOE|nr:hypothetical protein P7K49_011849 [Saguinus oedipus]